MALAPDITYSPEQEEVLSVNQGFHVVCANAGTGKTEINAELFVRRYVAEEAKLFPGQGHVAGEKQVELLRQFKAITFTVRGAQELHDRILRKFTKIGVPTPMAYGKPYRLCRTLDSLIQGWFYRPRIIKTYLRTAPSLAQGIKSVFENLSEEAQESMAGDQDKTVLFFRRWNWLPSEWLSALLLDTIVRRVLEYDAVPGGDMQAWLSEWPQYLAGLGEQGEWGPTYWDDKIAQWRKQDEKERAFSDEFRSGTVPNGHTAEQAKRRSDLFRELESLRSDLGTILSMARARGYHPFSNPEALQQPGILHALAEVEVKITLHQFHAIAKLFYETKGCFLILGFDDFMQGFLDVIRADPSMLEKGVEYPRYLRSKHVFWDEGQDNTQLQFATLKALCGHPQTPYLAVLVGDFKQQIYAWRGADPFQFVNIIRKQKEIAPDRFHTLTCSFRSARRVVELGNEVSLTLPSFRSTVKPSITIFEDDGHIIISPPLADREREATWVMQQISQRRRLNPKDSIMILSRNDPHGHPIADKLPTDQERISLMTVHKAKGLEADHVFLLECNSGVCPDVRGNMDQEANLFYVAVTRARKTLTFSIPQSRGNKKGDSIEAHPSPFFYLVPQLTELARLDEKWKMTELARGESYHRQQSGLFFSLVDTRLLEYLAELKTMFGGGAVEPIPEAVTDTGAADATDGVKAMPKRQFDKPATSKGDKNPMDAGANRQRRLMKICQEALDKGSALTNISKDDLAFCQKQGWAKFDEAEGAFVPTGTHPVAS
jgi:hypothetical protein